MRDPSLVILGYHKVGRAPWDAWGTWFYTPVDAFAQQLAYLRETGWSVIDAPAFLRALDDPESLPPRAVLITFDDGYQSLRQDALPVLVDFGYPAIVFMPSDFVGRSNEFEAGNAPEEPLCDWDDLRELQRHGVSVQSHGGSHRAFSELSPETQEQELSRSKGDLEAGLGTPVEVLAYPYGDSGAPPSGRNEMLERSGYQAACLYGGGPIRLPIGDRYSLPRVAIGFDTDLRAELEAAVAVG